MSSISPPSHLELRAELQAMVERDLLGPAGGEDEIVDERNVRARYVVGLLAPRGQSPIDEAPDELGELAVDGTSGGQDGITEAPIPDMDVGGAMFPSSVGLTFSTNADLVRVTVKWGWYRRAESELFTTPTGAPRRVWQRTQIHEYRDLALKRGKLDTWKPSSEQPDVYMTGMCRERDGIWSVTLFLVNAQSEPKFTKDEAWLFQPEISVESPDAAPIFVRRPLPAGLNHADDEDRAMDMLYRRTVEFAVGHGISVHVERAEDEWDRAVRICTRVIPAYEVERMDTPTAEQQPVLYQAIFDMKALAETPTGGFTAALSPLVEAYAAWIDARQHEVNHPPPDLAAFDHLPAVNIEKARESLERIWAGIQLLDQDEMAAEAFRFANRAMWMQRVRSLYTRAQRQGTRETPEAFDLVRHRSWRPFQLAFFLLNLPSLANPAHPERAHPTDAIADLLWFPTGGGKTEAYLGISAFAMAIRRLQGGTSDLTNYAGVTVLMRYTLRLLTLQQFQRATTLICACEVIRRENPAQWGEEPFRIGLWVGQRSTPNRTEDSAEAIREGRGNAEWRGNVGGSGTPQQLTNCPWCGTPIEAGRDIVVETYEKGRGRTFQFCDNGIGGCPFSRKHSPDEGIPIVVVDEEIYRRLPALLIATVDKFAQMPWKGATQMLFGRVNGYCERHGFISPEIEDAKSHPKKINLPAAEVRAVNPLRPPDLIIQDELHLISGPLGTLVGLYETAVDQLASWEWNGVTIRPKVIASTATIRRAGAQINSLFVRQVRLFPPSGLDSDDNFFSRRQPSSITAPGRQYIGICAPGTRLKAVLIRVYVAYMAAAQKLYEQYGARVDPWMTALGYFNSMRELGGMRRVVDDAVRTRLQKMDARGLTKRFIHPMNVDELTSRKPAVDIPKILDRLEAVFDPHMEVERKAKQGRGEKIDWGKSPLDVVLATNMISVGVDVGRLSLMMVASQPKATAEYIQATSRVGRSFPGLVCVVYNWARPRDLSHYERFEDYHATFYRHVEALSVTPFSPRALDRGLTGVMVALIRLLGEDFNENRRAQTFVRTHPFISLVMQGLVQRSGLVTGKHETEQLVEMMLKDRMDTWLSTIVYRTKNTGASLGYEATTNTVSLLKTPVEQDWDRFTCLNSLREVEPNVNLILLGREMQDEPNPTETAPSEAT